MLRSKWSIYCYDTTFDKRRQSFPFFHQPRIYCTPFQSVQQSEDEGRLYAVWILSVSVISNLEPWIGAELALILLNPAKKKRRKNSWFIFTSYNRNRNKLGQAQLKQRLDFTSMEFALTELVWKIYFHRFWFKIWFFKFGSVKLVL